MSDQEVIQEILKSLPKLERKQLFQVRAIVNRMGQKRSGPEWVWE